jgi:hypothetical protein
MLPFLLYSLILLIMVKHYGMLKNKYFIYNLMFLIVLFIFSTIESLYFTDSIFFLPDEHTFLRLSKEYSFSYLIENISNRYNVYLLNVKLSTILSPDIMLKLLNAPIIMILFVYLAHHYKNIEILKFAPFILPYMYIISLTNSREGMVNLVFFLLLFVMVEFKFKNLLYILVLSILLYSLRMPWLLVLWFSLFLFYLKSARIFIKILVVVLFASFIYLYWDFINSLFVRFNELGALGNPDVSQERYGVELNAENQYYTFMVALLKQIFSPIPLSKLHMMLFTNHISNNLYLVEITRVVMNTAFYMLMLYTLVHIKFFYKFIVNNKLHLVLFFVSIGSSILYALYLFGSGGSRTKLFPIILLFLFYVEMRNKEVFDIRYMKGGQ